MEKSELDELFAALEETLWVLEHPEVNKINFCGNPRYVAFCIRALLGKHGRTSEALDVKAIWREK